MPGNPAGCEVVGEVVQDEENGQLWHVVLAGKDEEIMEQEEWRDGLYWIPLVRSDDMSPEREIDGREIPGDPKQPNSSCI